MRTRLTDEQARELRIRARREAISLAEAIRRCIDSSLKSERRALPGRYEEASRLIGRFHGGRHARRLAEEHDRYLDEEW